VTEQFLNDLRVVPIRVEHMSDLIDCGDSGRKRIFRIKKAIREPDMEGEGIEMFSGRYRFPVGTLREDKAIADDNDDGVGIGRPRVACAVVANDPYKQPRHSVGTCKP
jgi:hypothetical protein